MQQTINYQWHKNFACNIPFVQPVMQHFLALRCIRKIELSSTFRNVWRQVAACDMSNAICNIILSKWANHGASFIRRGFQVIFSNVCIESCAQKLLSLSSNRSSHIRSFHPFNNLWRGRSLEIGLDQLGIMGQFYHHFAPKTDHICLFVCFFFSICHVRMRSISKTDSCSDGSILALLSVYEEFLVTFKMMTSQAIRRAWAVASYSIKRIFGKQCSRNTLSIKIFKKGTSYFKRLQLLRLLNG